MKVYFFANIRDYTNTKELDFEYCDTLEEFLHKLCNRFGKKLEGLVFKDEELSSEVIIMVNGRHISHLDGIKTKLKEDDKISIFPVVGGG